MVQHVAQGKDLVDEVLLLLLLFVSGQALAHDVEAVGLAVGLAFCLAVEAGFHLLAPEEA